MALVAPNINKITDRDFRAIQYDYPFDIAICGQLGFVRTQDKLYVRLLCSVKMSEWREKVE